MDADSTFSTRDLAKRWRVSRNTISGWIAAGELVAIDLSAQPGITRPRYRVTAEAVAEFESRRSTKPTHRHTARPNARASNGQHRDVVEFFK